MRNILNALAAVIVMTVVLFWAAALALAGPALLKFCVLYLFVEMSKTSPKTKGQREKEGGDHPAKRKSA